MNNGDSTPARILIVDDHAIVRHGLGVLLARAPDLTICGEAGDEETARTAVATLNPDAVVVDLILRERSGLDLIRALREDGYGGPVLVLSMHDEATHAPKSLRAGAQGYVMKEDADEVLVDALRKVLTGGTYFNAEVAARTMHDDDTDDHRAGVEQLTDREREIFACLGRGMTTRKMAEQFGISARTVEVHRARIKKKLGCDDAAQLLREAVKWVEERRV